jgi:hypothetical protein
MKALAEREDEAWREVDELIQQSQAKPYGSCRNSRIWPNIRTDDPSLRTV